MPQQNLILLPGIGMNSKLSEGVINLLNDYFKIHFIDFPGFISTIPPLPEFNMEAIAEYTKRQIQKLNLSSYLIASTSLGFSISQNLDFPKECMGYIAIHPYINNQSLNVGKFSQKSLKALCVILTKTGLANPIWRSRLNRKAYESFDFLLKGHPKSDLDNILNENDGRTYFETAKTIFSYDKKIKFDQTKPYVLLANPKDNFINYKFTTNYFTNNAPNLLILDSRWDHFPKDLSYEYFMNTMPKNYFHQITNFLNAQAVHKA